MSEQKLMAFWNYDRFPYTLHSEVTSFDTDKPGVVKVKGYGGSSFVYKHVCPIEIGEKIVAELEAVEKEFKRESILLSIKYHAELKKISERYGLPIKQCV